MSRKIVEYHIEEGGNSADLQDSVEELLQSGWQPYGSLYAMYTPRTGLFIYQAMVRYEGPEAEMAPGYVTMTRESHEKLLGERHRMLAALSRIAQLDPQKTAAPLSDLKLCFEWANDALHTNPDEEPG